MFDKSKEIEDVKASDESLKLKCKFKHSREICQSYLKGAKCSEKPCSEKHPIVCNWWQVGGCEGKTVTSYPLLFLVMIVGGMGCKNNCNGGKFVVQHVVERTKVFQCLTLDG